MDYDPDDAPDADTWLDLDESERIAAVMAGLQRRGEEPPPVRAAVQAVVETQVASGEPPATRDAVGRLTAEGLRRSIVLRVLTVKLIQHMQKAMDADGFDHEAYAADLEGLSGAQILAEALGAPGPPGHG